MTWSQKLRSKLSSKKEHVKPSTSFGVECPPPQPTWSQHLRNYSRADRAKTTAQPDHRSPSPLLRNLPLEIRLHIWREVIGGNLFHIAFDRSKRLLHCYLCQDFSTSAGSHGWDRYPRCQGSLRQPCFFYSRPICFFPWGEKYAFRAMSFLLTCRQIYAEAVDLLYAANVFNVDDSETLVRLMKGAVPRFRQIQTLHVNVAMWKIRCPDVSQIPAAQHPCTTQWTSFWAWLSKYAGLRHLRLDIYGTSRAGFEENDMEPLLQLKGLKTFDLAVWRDTDGPICTRPDLDLSLPLQALIRSSICQ
ncbi:MAG: hypothetical protein L6R40_004237 [Gallowayella cf. fulva]|nr:MAG: hypothetical protein L6R40_004237 [Xanthomendoza cf. fulva]